MRIIDLDESLSVFFEEKTLPTTLELSVGDTGQDVKTYQAALQSIGISPGPLDGIFGRETRAATVVFQNKHDLRPDGIAGKKTLTKLNGVLQGKDSKSTEKSLKKKQTTGGWGRIDPSTAQSVFDFFLGSDFTEVQSAALVGNFSVESLWTKDPAKALNPKDTNDQPSRGLAQWQGARWNNLGKFHGTRSEDTNLKQQLEFVVHELETTHKQAGRLLKNVTGSDLNALKQAVYTIRRYYEVAAPDADYQRFKYAKLALDQFSSDPNNSQNLS